MNTKKRVLEIENEDLYKDVSMLSKDIGQIEKSMKLKNLNKKDKPEFDKKVSELRKRNIEHRQKATLLCIRHVEWEGQAEQVEALNEELYRYIIFLQIGNMIGFVFSSFGLWFWYTLVQHPSDILLRKQVEDIQLKPSTATELPQEPPSLGEKEK